ncbi:MAG TPA: energy-coupling factor transporter transmembrane protein EcfT [Desulfitobacterium dehalogenans]|uniref:Energy-coupling factor transporter transmembrane protein EcfT n=1 Tax=Desulfitobacterium dehalogenans TaxID=36854 RepID=A0A7C7D4B4_9FIRM|nr:energy-coupling factor transporter transmembrane protein EcfT [Desulfitobacterium dehalogenans]
MAKDLTAIHSGEENKGLNKAEYFRMDGLVKLILAILLMVMPFWFRYPLSFGLLSIYLILIAWVFKVDLRTIAISGASFGIIVLIPYFFGLLMNALFFYFSRNPMFAFQGFGAVFLRLFKIFVIWYISILYFHTTPMRTFIGMLDKFLMPLKKLGLPVQDYLKVVMCIVDQLKDTGSEVKKSLGEKMRAVVGEERHKLRINVKGISQIIVNLIVDSFEKIDKVQEYVDKVSPEELYHYRFKFTLKDGVALVSFVVFVGIIWIIENGIINGIL